MPATSMCCSSMRARRRPTVDEADAPGQGAQPFPRRCHTRRTVVPRRRRPATRRQARTVARSVEAYATYFRRWALVWERQAMLRAPYRSPATATLPNASWRCSMSSVLERGLSADDEREIRRTKARIENERIPPGEDPAFHLKLGRGSLSDVEWTVQLLQLRTATRSPSTVRAIDALVEQDVLALTDAHELADAYRFCEVTRNRLCLVAGTPLDALPPQGSMLLRCLAVRGRDPSTCARTTAGSPAACLLRRRPPVLRRVARRCSESSWSRSSWSSWAGRSSEWWWW